MRAIGEKLQIEIFMNQCCFVQVYVANVKIFGASKFYVVCLMQSKNEYPQTGKIKRKKKSLYMCFLYIYRKLNFP